MLSCSLASIAVTAQSHTMYLNEALLPTTEPTAVTCKINEEFTSQGITVYDCYNFDNTTQYQLSQTLYILPDLIDSRYSPYLKPAEHHGYSLLGHYENGKPRNGFFRYNDMEQNEWITYDFYKDGIRTEQLCNNLFKSVIERYEDNETTWYLLNQKSVYKNGGLEDGIKVTSKKSKEGTAQVLENISNQKTVDYILGLFAMHYGEFIEIKPTACGYKLKSLTTSEAIDICYTAKGRIFKYYDKSNNNVLELDFFHQKLSDFMPSTLKNQESVKYFRQNNDIYIERLTHSSSLPESEEKYNELRSGYESRALFLLAEFFSISPRALSPDYILGILDNNIKENGEILGGLTFYEGKLYGIIYKQGTKKTTYTATLLDENEESIIAENKTVDEIQQILLSQMK